MQNKFIFKAYEADIKKEKASFFYELQNHGQTMKFEGIRITYLLSI
ncbi:MAG: hypothetical protein Q8P80_05695 [Candidatus Levybacteria bacterium]|nr:hypothetical protein [Candidatus Levybacteria bacterium]